MEAGCPHGATGGKTRRSRPEGFASEEEALRISTVLIDLRKHRGLSQDELARRFGVSASYLSLLERDKRPATARVLRSVARYLDIAAGLLVLQGTDPSPWEPRQQELLREIERDFKKSLATDDFSLLRRISNGKISARASRMSNAKSSSSRGAE